MTFGQEIELPIVCCKVVNHIGYFIEQEMTFDLGINGVIFSHTGETTGYKALY